VREMLDLLFLSFIIEGDLVEKVDVGLMIAG
jgi:hypothetical protein